MSSRFASITATGASNCFPAACSSDSPIISRSTFGCSFKSADPAPYPIVVSSSPASQRNVWKASLQSPRLSASRVPFRYRSKTSARCVAAPLLPAPEQATGHARFSRVLRRRLSPSTRIHQFPAVRSQSLPPRYPRSNPQPPLHGNEPSQSECYGPLLRPLPTSEKFSAPAPPLLARAWRPRSSSRFRTSAGDDDAHAPPREPSSLQSLRASP